MLHQSYLIRRQYMDSDWTFLSSMLYAFARELTAFMVSACIHPRDSSNPNAACRERKREREKKREEERDKEEEWKSLWVGGWERRWKRKRVKKFVGAWERKCKRETEKRKEGKWEVVEECVRVYVPGMWEYVYERVCIQVRELCVWESVWKWEIVKVRETSGAGQYMTYHPWHIRLILGTLTCMSSASSKSPQHCRNKA